jgi:hypothetical protein
VTKTESYLAFASTLLPFSLLNIYNIDILKGGGHLTGCHDTKKREDEI